MGILMSEGGFLCTAKIVYRYLGRSLMFSMLEIQIEKNQIFFYERYTLNKKCP